MAGRAGRGGGGGEVPFFPPDDPSNPLYLHPSDNPSTILVPELLIGSNCITWSRSMKTALLTKTKLGFVDGSVKKSPDLNDPLAATWEHCNGMVVSWLRNSTSPHIRSSLMYIDSALRSGMTFMIGSPKVTKHASMNSNNSCLLLNKVQLMLTPIIPI